MDILHFKMRRSAWYKTLPVSAYPFSLFHCKMLLNVRDSNVPTPIATTQTWVAGDDVSITIGAFLATLIVYDVGEHLLYVGSAIGLSNVSKLSHLTKRYPGPFLFT